MSKNDILKIQTCVLKVNIHCDGCEQKVKKLLQKIDGVYSVRVDAEEGKVVVAGNVDPAKLVKNLKRGGKHAEIWGAQKGMMHNHNYPIKPHFHNNMQLDNHKVGAGAPQGQLAQLAHLPNVNKGVQDLKVPPAKEQKSVKFNLPEDEFDASDDEYDEEEGLGHGHGHPMNHNEKADVIDQAMIFKGKGGNNNINKDKKSNQKGKNKKGVGGGDDDNGKSEGGVVLGRFLGFGKKSKKQDRDKASNNDYDAKTGKVINNAREGQMAHNHRENGDGGYYQGMQTQQHMPPPPMPSHPMADPITHTFSDENVESCTII